MNKLFFTELAPRPIQSISCRLCVCLYVSLCVVWGIFCVLMLLSAHIKRFTVSNMRDSFKVVLDKVNTSLSDPNISDLSWPCCIILVKSGKAPSFESGVSGSAFQLCVIFRPILV